MKKSNVADSIFTSSNLFRNPTKFKIMQNGNQKNDVYKSDITEKIYKKNKCGEIGELKSMRKEFESVRNHEASCFFLKAVDMYKLSNIPDFIGLNIAIGYDKEKKADVLIVVPVIRGRIKKETEQTNTAEDEMKECEETEQPNTAMSEMGGGAESVAEPTNTANDDTVEGPENVTDTTYTANGEERTTSTVVILASATAGGPCPPYPTGCCRCDCKPCR